MWIGTKLHERLWVRIAAFLVFGYVLYNRNFAYIGIPGAKVFIGDVLLALYLALGTGIMIGPWFAGLVRPTLFSGFFWALLLFVMYGVLQFARGVELGYSPVLALQELVFNVYPLYFFVGLKAALTYRDLIPKLLKYLTLAGCFGAVMFFVLRGAPAIGNFEMAWILVPMAGPWAVLGAISYFDLRRWWPAVVLQIFMVLVGQVRAAWVGLAAAVVVQAVLTRKLKPLAWTAASVSALLLMGIITDFKMPSPEGRGGAVSTHELVARALAPFDSETAYALSKKNAGVYAGTAEWRRKWWRAIWSSSQEDVETSLLGHGYGYALHELVPYLRTSEDLRTPHNVFYFALGYTGWIGVVLFFWVQASLGFILFRAAKSSGETFGIALWAWMLTGCMFGNGFETPFSAIPYYLLVGMAAADLDAKAVSAEVLVKAPALAPF